MLPWVRQPTEIVGTVSNHAATLTGPCAGTPVIADITGHDVTVVTNEVASAIGTAFVAGIGVGIFDDRGEIERFVTRGASYQPNPDAVDTDHHGCAIYRQLYDRLPLLFPALQRLQSHLA